VLFCYQGKVTKVCCSSFDDRLLYCSMLLWLLRKGYFSFALVTKDAVIQHSGSNTEGQISMLFFLVNKDKDQARC
jgi:hypothetical protein